VQITGIYMTFFEGFSDRNIIQGKIYLQKERKKRAEKGLCKLKATKNADIFF
jgi:hypothetical protein